MTPQSLPVAQLSIRRVRADARSLFAGRHEVSEIEIDRLKPPVRLAESVYGTLRDAIFSGAIAPGARLSVPLIADRLGVSRSPVREAVVRLCQEKLALERPRRGAVVAVIGQKDLAALYEVRTVLEGLAARLAVQRSRVELRETLAAILAKHQSSLDAGDWEGRANADAAFHYEIRRAAKNPELLGELDSIQSRVQLAMLTTSAFTSPERALADHRSIFQAIEVHDPELARSRAEAHIERLRTVLLQAESSGSEIQDPYLLT